MKDTEHRTQVAFCRWLKANDIFHFAIPNGGARNAITGKRLKDEGVLAGVPDLFIPEMRLFIEMKAPNGRITNSQKQVIQILKKNGYFVHIAYNLSEAVNHVIFYQQRLSPQLKLNNLKYGDFENNG